MTVPFVLLVVGALAAAMTPRLLSRAAWPEREPVLALWVWQCVVAAVLLCCVLAMALSAAAASAAVRWHLFGFAPHGVVDAYGLPGYGRWAGSLAVLLACGGVWTAAMLTREVRGARARRRQRRAELLVRSPRLPGEEPPAGDRLVVLEGDRPDAWWLSGAQPQLVVTTAALRRLKGRQLDAVLAHEQGHVRARHDVLLHCAGALASGFPQVPVFAGFRDQVHRLIELSADDTASRRFGRLTTALALVELNEDRGVFGPCPTPLAELPRRVHRLLDPAPRLAPVRRAGLTATALLVPAVPLLIAFVPGLSALA
ncbi:M56 family metallopeptidase [Streptomyces sp. SID13666]|uniref:M56 family metallopeptidase n=1 Tax=unclassified Streptomyces TaxID=2593676 RepID=UPI0013C118FE|nr:MULTISPECIES: M56 family metallopeptidase [unclassified Streptomyces]NEA56018.1 M56 family metallopeptidase [Streptomyces sp. SID13666]NEA72001.1 M56 family metallopeptidase [Streptomyces sp. SID13588]